MFRTLFLVLVPSIWYLWPCSCHDSHSMWAEEVSWDLLCVLVSESFRSEESWELSWNQHGDLTSGVTWSASDLRPPFLLHQTSSLLGIFMQFNSAHGLGVSAVMGLCFPCFEHQAWCDTYCFEIEASFLCQLTFQIKLHISKLVVDSWISTLPVVEIKYQMGINCGGLITLVSRLIPTA